MSDPTQPIPVPVTIRKNKLDHRMRARIKSVELAIQLKPALQYDDTTGRYIEQPFDLLNKSLEIYNWLIQDL